MSLWISFFAKCETFNVVDVSASAAPANLGYISVLIIYSFIYYLAEADGKSPSCRTNLLDVRTMRPIPKNINEPVH